MTGLEKLCERLRIRAIVSYGVSPRNYDKGDWRLTAHPWTVRLVRYVQGKRRELTTPFWTGSGLSKEPTAADVLACLVEDAQSAEESFDGWCATFGYDSDSRKAEGIYQECKRLAPRVRGFLGDDWGDFLGAEY